jgi:rare lipoprotein A
VSTLAGAVIVACLVAVGAAWRPPPVNAADLIRHALHGNASWYGTAHHGRRTASGEAYDSEGMTAAHRTLPFGAPVRVTNQRNGRSAVVRINDRGPFVQGRIIDLSGAAARAIGISGVARVSLSRVAGVAAGSASLALGYEDLMDCVCPCRRGVECTRERPIGIPSHLPVFRLPEPPEYSASSPVAIRRDQ